MGGRQWKVDRSIARIAAGDIELEFPEFKHGKQDYWGGFALELVLEDLNNAMSLTPGGTMGQDLSLKRWIIGNFSKRMMR